MDVQTKYAAVADSIGLLENIPEIADVIDTAAEHLSQQLEIDLPEGQLFSVAIQSSGMSEVNQAGQIVVVMQHDHPYSDRDWCEMIFSI